MPSCRRSWNSPAGVCVVCDEAHKRNLRVAAHIYYLADVGEVGIQFSQAFEFSLLYSSRQRHIARREHWKAVWKHYSIEEAPKPTRKNSIGTQLWGPSGGSVWNTPTVDPRLGVIYFGTGEATNQPAPETTDAVLAVDIKTGKLAWSYQGYGHDAYITAAAWVQPDRL